jgi:hypothetical protein
MTWRNDQCQYSLCLYQGGHEPLGHRARWMPAWGERAGPERPPEVRCRPPKREGLVERSHGESTRSGLQPTGKSPPASTPCTMGQRTNPEGSLPRKVATPDSRRGWLRQVTWFTRSPFGIPQSAGWVDWSPPPTRPRRGHRRERGRLTRGDEQSIAEARERRSGHSSRRLGKPATGRRAAVCWDFLRDSSRMRTRRHLRWIPVTCNGS